MQKLERNIGPKNRLERGVIGAAAVLLAFSSNSWIIFTSLFVIGAVLLGEAFSGHCIYHHYRKTKNMR